MSGIDAYIGNHRIPPRWRPETIVRQTKDGELVRIRYLESFMEPWPWRVSGGGYGPWTDPLKRGRYPRNFDEAMRAADDLAARRFGGWAEAERGE